LFRIFSKNSLAGQTFKSIRRELIKIVLSRVFANGAFGLTIFIHSRKRDFAFWAIKFVINSIVLHIFHSSYFIVIGIIATKFSKN
jgi:hypothetical protein